MTMRKIILISLYLVLALNVLALEPMDQVNVRVRTFKADQESRVFYQNTEIMVEIVIINNYSANLDLEVNYELDAAQGEFESIKRTRQIIVPAGQVASFSDSFLIGESISSGTFIVKATAKESSQIPGPQGNSVTGNSFITIFSGTQPETLNVPEIGFLLAPLVGFGVLFLLSKKP